MCRRPGMALDFAGPAQRGRIGLCTPSRRCGCIGLDQHHSVMKGTRVAYLHVVTSARSFSSALHFKLLQVSGKSIISASMRMPLNVVLLSVGACLMPSRIHGPSGSWSQSHLLRLPRADHTLPRHYATKFFSCIIIINKATEFHPSLLY